MWIMYAIGSSFFAGITSILAKCGIRKTDSTVATAIRTVVVLLFSWLMAAISGSVPSITQIDSTTLLFLILSGIATGASWLCYFRALQNGDVNKVVPIDKSSTALTIVLAMIFLNEGLSWDRASAVILIGVGTMLMISKCKSGQSDKSNGNWMIFAVLSAVFASVTAIFGRIGIEGVESNLGTAIRTTVVIVMAWAMVFVEDKQSQLKVLCTKELLFVILSGISTGASWLCYYHALQNGPTSAVVSIDKLSILITVAFSRVAFGEKLTKKALLGVSLITLGTLLLVLI